MASLTHPNIVAVHDCGQIHDQYYLVMEHVAGRSLRDQMVEGQPWLPARAAPVLKAIAQALSYIHSRGILHISQCMAFFISSAMITRPMMKQLSWSSWKR